MVRAYNRTVAMNSTDITPELAIALAHRNLGVFTGSPESSPALAATTVVDVRSTAPCADDSGARIDPGLASQLGVACGLHTWVSTLFAGVDLLNIEERVGAVFHSTTDRLQGVSVYLDRLPDRAELSLYEVGGRGGVGRELARAKAVGTDEFGLVAFTFDPIAGSAGKEYAFVLSCPGCQAEKVPRLIAGHSVDQPGNLLRAGNLHRDRSAAFAPIYEPVAADPRSTTTVDPSRPGPGRWRIRANGAQPALVVVAEAYFPGWEAKVDGAAAPVVEADGGFLGVPVDAGDHVITLEYHRPAAAALGRLVTAATLLIVAGGAVRRRRRRVAARPAAERRVAAVPPSRPPPLVAARPSPAPAGPARPARERPAGAPPAPRPSPVAPGRPSPDQPDWDEVVQPYHPDPDGHPAVERPEPEPDPASEPPPPARGPKTVRWPPEPF